MSIKQRVYLGIRDQIIYGNFLPGESLKEKNLSEIFGCSRGPVREALAQLSERGFITIVPNQGATVNKTTLQEIGDFYSLLGVLEGQAVEWAIPFLTRSDIADLSHINSSMMKIALRNENFAEDWVKLNIAFHRVFRKKCGNEKMDWLIQEIRLRITRYRYVSLLAKAFNDYIEDHKRIIEAARMKNISLGRQAMENHIAHSKNVLMDFLSGLPSM